MNYCEIVSCGENVEAPVGLVSGTERLLNGVSELASSTAESRQQGESQQNSKEPERRQLTSPDPEGSHQLSPEPGKNLSGSPDPGRTHHCSLELEGNHCNSPETVRTTRLSKSLQNSVQPESPDPIVSRRSSVPAPSDYCTSLRSLIKEHVESSNCNSGEDCTNGRFRAQNSTISRLLPSLDCSTVDRFRRSLLLDKSLGFCGNLAGSESRPPLSWSQSLPEDLSQVGFAAASRLLLPLASVSDNVQPLRLTTSQRRESDMNKNSDTVSDLNVVPNSSPVGASTMPIRYILEFLDAPQEGACELDKDHENYAIIATSTPISQLKSALLSKCSLEHLADHECSVYVCVRNWRRLPLELVTSGDPDKLTVADMFTTVSSCVTLRLVCSWPAAVGRVISCLQKRLLKICLQLTVGGEQLQRLGCPLDQTQLSQLTSSGCRTFPLEAAAKFNQWFDSVTQSKPPPDNSSHPSQQETTPRPAAVETSKHERSLSAGLERSLPVAEIAAVTADESSPVQMVSRPRMRTTFDIEYEMPKLQKWFSLEPHPNRAQMQFYTDQLNAYRQANHRRPLEVTNILYWFKNARAAHKKLDSARVGDESAVNASNTFERSCHGDESSGASSSSTSDREPEDAAPTSLLKIEHCDSDSETEKESVNGASGMDMGEYENGHHTSPQPPDRVPSTDPSSAVNFGLPGSYMGPMGLSYGGVNPAMFRQSMSMYMSGCLTGLQGYTPPTCTPSFAATPSASSYGLDQLQRKRNRTFIDPVSEVPMLERWFLQNTHPCHTTILRYTDELNRQSYRQRFPRLEPKNVQFWFKNRRAKTKRLRSGSLSADCGLFPQKLSKVEHADQHTIEEI